MKHLIIGGARSGKSRYALNLAQASGEALYYLATAEARDEEMTERIARHKAERDGRWTLVEEPLALAEALAEHDAPGRCIVVDCLTLWLSNCLEAGCWAEEKRLLLQTLETVSADLIFIANEVGSGIIPLGELSRQFVDESGWLQQALAGNCERVTTVIAGLPLTLKEPLSP